MRASSAARDADTDADALELGGDAPSPSSSPREGFEVVDTFVVDASLASMQLPDVVHALWPERFATATAAKKAVRRGEFLVHEPGAEPRVRKCQFRCQGGERVEWRPRVVSASRMDPQEVPAELKPLTVLYEDGHMALVVKPVGITTHHQKGHASDAPPLPSEDNPIRGWHLERLIQYYLQPSQENGALWKPRCVHRLDLPTGGVLCCAKTRPALARLGESFSSRATTKRYRAIVVGQLQGAGRITTPLLVSDCKGKKTEKAADTSYAVVHVTRSAAFGHVTTVDLWPHTGRTHQLRRHLAGLGHPIVGETEHCDRQLQLQFAADGCSEGLFLYAVELSVPHPVTNELLTVQADEPARYAAYRERQAASCI